MSLLGRRNAAWLVTVVLASALAPPASAAKGQSLTLGAALSTLYDDNLIQYSDAQLKDFESGLHPGRFSIDTRDDAIFNPSLVLLWELDQGRGRKHALRLKGEGNFHDQNRTADDRSLSVSWRESFHDERRVSVGYYFMPQYYLRQLLDEDLTTLPASVRYRRAQFSLGIASASWSQRVGRSTQVELAYLHEQRNYNSEFRERTSGLHQGVLMLGWSRLPRRSSIDLSGGYRKSDAKATDGDELPGQVSDDADVSYHGVIGGFSGKIELARSRRFRLMADLAWELETRRFDSSVPTDKYHFGRDDLRNTIELGLRASDRRHWSLRSFYRFEHNRANLGASAPSSADAGSYSQNQVGAAVEWSGVVWTLAQAAPGEDTEN